MTVKIKKAKTMFVDGVITPDFIADRIASHASMTAIGAHQIFLGQIRADEVEGSKVKSIDFTANKALANELYVEYRERLFTDYNINCLHVYHSLGEIKAGEINLFVFVSAAHRHDAIKSCAALVEWIKTEVPVWGKVNLENEDIAWKNNK